MPGQGRGLVFYTRLAGGSLLVFCTAGGRSLDGWLRCLFCPRVPLRPALLRTPSDHASAEDDVPTEPSPPGAEFSLPVEKQLKHSLAELRVGHDGLEQFLGLLFDELEDWCERLERQQQWVTDEQRAVLDQQSRLSMERARWETDQQHEHRVWQKRIDELERERVELMAELDELRAECAQLTKSISEQQRHFTEERREWTAELRHVTPRAS